MAQNRTDIRRIWYKYTMEHYMAIKKIIPCHFWGLWTEMEGIILSELEGERIPDGFAYMYNLEKPKNQTKTNCKPNP